MSDFLELIPLQKKLIEVLGDFHEFCVSNDIEYYVYGGTALGAVRHGGFIPWDDDIDVIMTQKNFDKLCVLSKKFTAQDRYYLQVFSKNTNESICGKWRANGTTFIETIYKNKKIHQGMFIDIFALQEAPDSSFQRIMQYIVAKYLSVQEYASRPHKSKGMALDIVCSIVGSLPRFFCTRNALKFIKRWNGRNTNYYSKFTEGCRYKDGYFSKDIMGKPKLIKFDRLYVYAPAKIEEFLDITYGDWQKIPNENQISSKLHCEYFDVKRDFREYLEIEDFSDEDTL